MRRIALLLLLAAAAAAAEEPAASTEAATATPEALCGEDKGEGDCPVFVDAGPLTADELASIKAGAAPAPARAENYLDPFDANEPCPDVNIMQSNYTQGQVEAQVREGVFCVMGGAWAGWLAAGCLGRPRHSQRHGVWLC
jgi:hypothetical protein